MNGLFIYIGKNIPDSNKNNELFCIYPWIKSSTVICKDYSISNFYISDGINGDIYENDEYVLSIQGFIFINEEPVVNAEKLLTMIKKKNIDFLKRIQTGSFNIVILNKKLKTLTLINDRFGLLPLYYYLNKDEFIISSRIDAIKVFAKKSFEINYDGLKDILTFGYLVGFDTLYKNINLFPPSSILKTNLHGKKINIKKYWNPSFNHIDNKNILSKKLFLSLQNSIKRLSSLTEHKKICFLSGGLDSRTIYALHKSPIDTFTAGFIDSQERKFAKLVTDTGLKGRHIESEYTEEIMRKYFLKSIKLTEGTHLMRTSYIPYIAEKLRNEGYKLRYDGYLGDVLFGGTYFSKIQFRPKEFLHDILDGSHQTPLNLKNINVCKKKIVNSIASISYNIQNFNPKNHVNKRIENLIKLTLDETPNLIYIEDMIDILQIFFARGRRFIKFGGIQHQYFYDVVYPFFDYDVFNVYLEIPPKYRSWHRIYNDMYKKYLNEYQTIPCTILGGLPPETPNFIVRTYLYTKTLFKRYKSKKDLTYVDFDKWLKEGTLYRKDLEKYANIFNELFKDFQVDIKKIPNDLLFKIATVGAYLGWKF